MTPLSIGLLRQALLAISKDQWNYLTQGHFKDLDPTSIQPEYEFKLMLVDWLAHLGCIGERQQVQIITLLHNDLVTFMEEWRSQKVFSLDCVPQRMMTISDGRYLSWTGRNLWFDLIRDCLIETLPEPAVTHLSCDVGALIVQTRKRLSYLCRSG